MIRQEADVGNQAGRPAVIGAVLYVVWSLLHLMASLSIYHLASTLPDSVQRGRLEQGGWNLAVFSLQALIVAATLNWRNNRVGYWINVIGVGVVDLGYVLLLIVPGYVPVSLVALTGPIIYVVAAGFSTLGYIQSSGKRAHLAWRSA